MDLIAASSVFTATAFSRATAASSLAASPVESGVPRVEDGYNGMGALLIEEATANLLTSNQATLDDGTTSGFNKNAGTETLAADSNCFLQSPCSLRVTTTSNGSEGAYCTVSALSAGSSYTFSVWLRGSGSVRLYAVGSALTSALAGSLITLSATWTRYSLTFTTDVDGGAVNLLVYTSNQTITFWADCLQFENKNFATTFVNGSRNSELVSVSSSGIIADNQPFTIEAWVKINDGMTGSYWMIASDWTKFYLSRYGSGLLISWYDGTQKSVSGGSGFTIGSWHQVVMVFTGATVIGYLDGAQVCSAATTLPTASSGTLKIGQLMGSYLTNGLISGLRVSSVARSAAEISAAYASYQPVQWDASTAGILACHNGRMAWLTTATVISALPRSQSRHSVTASRNQASHFSLGGAFYLYDRGGSNNRHKISWQLIPKTMLTAILAFLDGSTVRGGMKQFCWVDEHGRPRLVRSSGPVDYAEHANALYRLGLDLEET